jgi:DNA-binding CsgD family transcriptional regulator
MLVRVPKKNREITRGVGIVFCLLFVIQSARFFVIIFHEQQIDSYFNLDNSEGFFLLTYEFILIVMTYTISLMYNKKWIIDVKEQEKINTRLYAENLQLELNLKNKELSQKALNIASMKEFNKNILSEIKDDISGIENSNIQKTIKKLTNITRKEKIWQEFDDRLKDANSEFYKKILVDYSNLSTNEIRVAFLIRQNHTTKEIAEILQRSPKTIENSRSLLRKKMNLEQEVNLAKFLKSIK